MQNEYTHCFWKKYDYSKLNIGVESKKQGNEWKEVNSAFIMIDTETSKSVNRLSHENHVVYFTLSINAKGKDICTLYGYTPSDAVNCINKVCSKLSGDLTYIYVHNLSYDWTFLRRFFIARWGNPVKQLNVKSHYPIYIEFLNGVILRDSLILAQRKLEKWGEDLDIEHKKAVGYWDYSKIRNQDCSYSDNEHKYAEFDTLCGVECLEATRRTLGKKVSTMPWTATGIAREKIRKAGKMNRAREWFLKNVGDYQVQLQLELTYHGGFTHANRHFIAHVFREIIKCFDFTSSYPYCLIAFKYPAERFYSVKNCKIREILLDSESYAYTFKLCAMGVKLKNDKIPMPPLQASKAVKLINEVSDNGRILCCDYIEIYLTEIDLQVISEFYDFDYELCIDVKRAVKDYLPRWFTDLVFEFYKNKTQYKGGDPVLYSIAKSLLNSLYGVCVQKPVKDLIVEDYISGEYNTKKVVNYEDEYNKWVDNQNNILPYQIGVWCTAYAFRNLFELGSCVKDGYIWIYSDTDSAYSNGWDYTKIERYNYKCKELLLSRGYRAVNHEGVDYWLGVAVSEGDSDRYSEFVTLGAKRYCGRSCKDNKLHITVAGVPKKGAECLKNDITKFKKGFCFDGKITGKLTHEYIYSTIHTDECGNEIGDSIDLTPCNYILDDVTIYDWQSLINDDIQIVMPGMES